MNRRRNEGMDKEMNGMDAEDLMEMMEHLAGGCTVRCGNSTVRYDEYKGWLLVDTDGVEIPMTKLLVDLTGGWECVAEGDGWFDDPDCEWDDRRCGCGGDCSSGCREGLL